MNLLLQRVMSYQSKVLIKPLILIVLTSFEAEPLAFFRGLVKISNLYSHVLNYGILDLNFFLFYWYVCQIKFQYILINSQLVLIIFIAVDNFLAPFLFEQFLNLKFEVVLVKISNYVGFIVKLSQVFQLNFSFRKVFFEFFNFLLVVRAALSRVFCQKEPFQFNKNFRGFLVLEFFELHDKKKIVLMVLLGSPVFHFFCLLLWGHGVSLSILLNNKYQIMKGHQSPKIGRKLGTPYLINNTRYYHRFLSFIIQVEQSQFQPILYHYSNLKSIIIQISLPKQFGKINFSFIWIRYIFYIYFIFDYLSINLFSLQHMDSLSHLLEPVNTFIRGDTFFHYHGLVLSTLWMVGAVIAILARRVSVYLHASLFFIIDVTTAFFIVGAMLRVYPYIIVKWDDWSLLKKGHFIGGGVFLVMLVIQHAGGVLTLLKGVKFNPSHRLFGFYVSNFGRILAFFGSVIAEAEPWIIYTSGGITVFLLIASTYKVFFASYQPTRSEKKKPDTAASSSPSRNKSPKRD